VKVQAAAKTKKDAVTASSCEQASVKYKKWAIPYDRKEAWGLVVRHIFGIDTRRNRGIVGYIPHQVALNENVDSKAKIGVVGDIMDMIGRVWIPGGDLQQFFSDCDYMLGNFEATIITATQKGPSGVIFGVPQRHDENIITSLRNLFDPKRTYLSLANNHAGDFGQLAFERSIDALKQNGFHVFGLVDEPFADVGKHIRIITGTKWSNQVCDYIVSLDSLEKIFDFTDQGRFNILYPHWGYELELYPRPETIEQGNKFIQRFDAVIGHHSHIPQPLTQADHNVAKTIIAYGLGDICAARNSKKYQYGIALKFGVGLDQRGAWVIGDLEWSFTRCRPISKGEYQTNLIPILPYLL
jgi:Bacterial capsule synthesis protein PGA_cap